MARDRSVGAPIALAPVGFDPGAGRWRARDSGAPVDSGDPGQGPTALTVVTHNVFFIELGREHRWQAVLDQAAGADADVIAFQEVTAPFLRMLLDAPWVRERYLVSDADGSTFPAYGVVMLSRLPVARYTLHDLPSSMARRLLVAELGGGLAVATVHLESLPPSLPTREVQFGLILDILSEFDHAVLMGDMNFCATWSENSRVPPAYTDVWPALHPGDPGWTVDSHENRMVQDLVRKPKQVRYDRVFMRSADAYWRPRAITRLGTEPVPGHPDLYPSDHFGLCARFERAP
ncbi:endonuclease/exonuclease/phosphatase family protein [Haliangium sp.]|uniref:endonuclease/exonuclease/phosphatase family protein n=1 Tax=Haliangium sp. TaxID=2663208 RepID=UPI003D0F64A1